VPTDRDFRYDLRRRLQPALQPACALAAGVAASRASQLPAGVWMALAAAAAVASMATRRRRWSYAVMLLAVSACGAGRYAIAAAERPLARLVGPAALRAGNAIVVEGMLAAPVGRPPGLARLRVAAGSIFWDAHVRAIAGYVAVTVSIRTPEESAAFDALGLDYGARVRVACVVDDDLAYRNPGAETSRERLRRDGVDLAGRARVEGLTIAGVPAGCPILAALYGARERGSRAFDDGFSLRTAGLLRALVLGDGSRLDRETADAFRRAGLFHILVVSGAHVMLVAAALLWPARRFIRSAAVLFALGAVPVWAYTLALGMTSPCVRAALAVTLALAASLAQRPAPPANTVSVIAIVVLLWDPASLFDPSFQLTFAAVAALVLVAAPLDDRLADVGRWRPRRGTPYPPHCARPARVVAEALYWSQRRFERRQRREPARYALDKAPAAALFERLRVQGLARLAVRALLATLVVQIALAPLSVAHFRRVSPSALAATVPVEALLALALACGFAYLALHAASPDAATWLVPPIEAMVRGAREIAVWAASAPWGTTRVPAPVDSRAILPWVALAAVAALAIAASRWHPVRRTGSTSVASVRSGRLLCAALAAAVAAGAAVVIGPDRPPGDGRLRVLFLDVGQGDATLVRFPSGETMLVDAGGRPRLAPPLGFEDGRPVYGERFDVGERVVCEALWALGISRLDLVAVSHGDVDHAGGFDAVLDNFAIGRALLPPDIGGEGARIAGRLRARGVPIVELSAGNVFDFGGARVEAVWPEPNWVGGDNDRSLALRLSFGRRAVLLTGDMEERAEWAAIGAGWRLAADVLKVPHHGSRTSSSDLLLRAVSPRVAVVSAPRVSPYGHPHTQVCERLRAHGATLFQTGVDGAVEVVTDGEGLVVTSMRDTARSPTVQ
jgi:competence protein ComEC